MVVPEIISPFLTTDYTVFGRASCPYCTKAVDLLERNSSNYSYVSLDSHPESLKETLKEYLNWKTVPMIFRYGSFVGGFTELKDLLDREVVIDVNIDDIDLDI